MLASARLSRFVWCLALLTPLQLGCSGASEPECPGRSDGETWCDGDRALSCDTDYEDCSSGYCERKSVVRLLENCGSSGAECYAGECVLPQMSCMGSVCIDGVLHGCLDGRVQSDGTVCGDLGGVCAVEFGQAKCDFPQP